jgi:hypothetical protein
VKAGHIILGDLGNGEQRKDTPAEGIPNTTTAADIEWALHQRRVRRAREGRFPDRT